MGYSLAVEKAWSDVTRLAGEKHYTVKFISDIYDIDIESKSVISTACNVCAKDYVAIIVLHYLARKLALGDLPMPTGQWMDFTELDGGEGYYPTFKKRTIEQVVRKYGDKPEALLDAAGRMNASPSELGDVGLVVHPFTEVAILVKMSRADDEFPPDAGILFDRNISGIFCTEDVVVLTELIVHQL